MNSTRWIGAAVAVLATLILAQQSRPLWSQEPDHVVPGRVHASWPAPELIAAGLRSQDEKIRLNALRLLGLDEKSAHEMLWSQVSGKPIGTRVITADQIRLTYAALGQDETQEAVVAIQADSMVYAAVAIPTGSSWMRIASFISWSKYDMGAGDALSEAVELSSSPEEPRSPQHFELVLRASGGGTGIYTQGEAHFRVHHNELVQVISLVSRKRSCNPTAPPPFMCLVERRWFYPTTFDAVRGAMLMEAHGKFAADNPPDVLFRVRGLEDRYLRSLRCASYRWNESRFRYERIAAVTASCRSNSITH